MDTDSTPSSSTTAEPTASEPLCILVLGMAGSGKSTFVRRLAGHLHAQGNTPYLINLDPAVHEVSFPASVDIRDTVDYKKLMKEYSLGPNGAIMTALNLFSTRFDKVVELVESNKSKHNVFIFDTPGQIEAFTWSASGSIITETLGSTYPTMVAYVLDIARSERATTFMSNMLYACSIFYKTKLPFLVVMNKTDTMTDGGQFAESWMSDFEAFGNALDNQSTSYMADLTRSLSLALDSFYCDLNRVYVSALKGTGLEKFVDKMAECKQEYANEYKPMYDKLRAEKQEGQKEQKRRQVQQMKKDAASGGGDTAQFLQEKMRGISIGSALIEENEAEDDENRVAQREDSEEEDEDEKREYESFKRFLEEQKKILGEVTDDGTKS